MSSMPRVGVSRDENERRSAGRETGRLRRGRLDRRGPKRTPRMGGTSRPARGRIASARSGPRCCAGEPLAATSPNEAFASRVRSRSVRRVRRARRRRVTREVSNERRGGRIRRRARVRAICGHRHRRSRRHPEAPRRVPRNGKNHCPVNRPTVSSAHAAAISPSALTSGGAFWPSRSLDARRAGGSSRA